MSNVEGSPPPETPPGEDQAPPPVTDGGSPPESSGPYETLGVSRTASQDEINAAYQRFTSAPDLWIGTGPDREERLQRIEVAYRILSDPTRRGRYDALAAGGITDHPAPAPMRKSWNPIDRATRNLPRPWRIAIDWAVTIIGAILIVLALKQWIVNPYRIPSSSMEPTLHCAKPGQGCQAHFSDRVLACRICLDFSSPSRGDIIVFKTPPEAAQRCGEGGTFVKRLIGLPGDRIHENGRGYIFVDGKKLNEPYVQTTARLADTSNFNHNWGPIPKGQYFFMGDNRAESCDSRQWGTVPRGNLIGVVFFVYWPPNRIGFR
ncbi:MAG TPA: signal peptidase I [Gaiellaceae bacterium]|nr:signal peptidase I [Gaiellaceae bacterium]